jgi:hypothetical protein
MAMSLSTPVAFLIFNRPDLTETVFRAIARARPAKLLVVADGPRSAAEAEKCRQARAVIESVDWDCEVLTNFSEDNLGCKQRVASGLDWIFSSVDEAIILEDDCLPAPSFFGFCEELLDRYRHDMRIMHVCGSNFLAGREQIDQSYYYSRYSFCWGWASWKRAWKFYDPEMKSWPHFQQQGLIEKIFEDPDEQSYWTNILASTFNGEIDTWDFQWFYTCFAQGGLTVVPSVNLVSNLGLRPDATHTKNVHEREYLGNIPAGSIDRIDHPEFVVRHRDADRDVFESYFGGSHLHPQTTWVNRARGRLAALKGKALGSR